MLRAGGWRKRRVAASLMRLNYNVKEEHTSVYSPGAGKDMDAHERLKAYADPNTGEVAVNPRSRRTARIRGLGLLHHLPRERHRGRPEYVAQSPRRADRGDAGAGQALLRATDLDVLYIEGYRVTRRGRDTLLLIPGSPLS